MATRRYGKVLEAAILDAVNAELAERGYDGLTYESVAARAGTSKPVIYRRWATKAELVAAAALMEARPLGPVADTGSLAGDLSELLRTLRRAFERRGRLTVLNLLAQLDHEAAGTVQGLLIATGAQHLDPILARARERGELGSLPIPDAVLALPMDLARHDALILGVLTDEAVDVFCREICVPLFALHSQAGGRVGAL